MNDIKKTYLVGNAGAVDNVIFVKRFHPEESGFREKFKNILIREIVSYEMFSTTDYSACAEITAQDFRQLSKKRYPIMKQTYSIPLYRKL